MTRHTRLLHCVLLGVVALGLAAPGWAANFEAARIFIEYNSTDNDLGFHVFLDAEQWKTVKIVNPNGTTIFEVTGKGAYGKRGLSELFTEGAEPSLDEVPLDQLLDEFPEGKYKFIGVTVDGLPLVSTATLSHAVPAGPAVHPTEVNGDTVVISWDPVTGPPPDFPQKKITIVGYQIIVAETFQVTLPATSTQVTLPKEFVQSLKPGRHGFEVLAIEASGNQTITQGSFETQ
jgi:hypothetical protein